MEAPHLRRLRLPFGTARGGEETRSVFSDVKCLDFTQCIFIMPLLKTVFEPGFLQNLLEDVDAFVRQCKEHALEKYVSTTLSWGTPSCLWVLFKRGMS